jgi:glucokinase
MFSVRSPPNSGILFKYHIRINAEMCNSDIILFANFSAGGIVFVVKHCCIAGDIGGTNVRVALVSEDFRILSKLKEPSGGDTFAILIRLIDELRGSLPEGYSICGAGLAVAGIVDKAAGSVLRAPNIQKLSGFVLGSEVSNRISIPVIIENDANAAAYGEKVAGAGRDFDDFVMLTLGTGIGGGIVYGGRLLSVAAEIGHLNISSNGPICGCGNSGCLETYASARAIIGNAVTALEKDSDSMMKKLYNGNTYKITAEDIYHAALEGDTLARMLLRDAGRALGIGLANIINLLSPQAVILTGGLLGAWNIYVETAISEASKKAIPELFERVKILPSTLGDDAGAIGMAGLVFEKNKQPRTRKTDR